MNQKGAIALIAPLLILMLLILGAAVFILKPAPLLTQSKESAVSLQKQYQNPFDKDTQYVNPFSEYQNPFDNLR